MKIVICDSKEALGGSAEWQKAYLEKHLKNSDVEIYYYEGNQMELYARCNNAEGLLTAFLPMNRDFLKQAVNLEAISISAVGYNTVDMGQIRQQNITVMTLNEYCTDEVADHTLALLLTLNRNIKRYEEKIWKKQEYDYMLSGSMQRLRGQKLGIFGYGKIGRAVATRARAFGLEIYVYQNPLHPVQAEPGINLASAEEIYEKCSIISNHMPQSAENNLFFDQKAFEAMRQKPIFINTGRGSAVDEKALRNALTLGQIKGAALDVLESETPNLKDYNWLQQDNVIITPHAAFYSQQSMEALRRISCDNLIYFFTGQKEKITKIVK